jgi:hypothetical protein
MGSFDEGRILPISAIVMDNGEMAPLADFQDTVLPSVDIDTVPSCFLYWAAALDMLEEEGGLSQFTVAGASDHPASCS